MVDAPAQHANSDAELTQQAILETALEDFRTGPFRTAPESELEPQPDAPSEPASVLERKLKLVLKSDPELERTPEPEVRSENVTMADFGQRAPRTVPVVSVVMNRKCPNMVRVVAKSTRLAT